MKKLIIKFKDGTIVSVVVADHFSREAALDIYRRGASLPLKEIESYGFESQSDEGATALSFIKLKNDKALEIRTIRGFFLKSLDIPFMMSIENENEAFKSYIVSLKNFLRDLPKNLKLDSLKSPIEIATYNPFNNIFRIEVAEQGDGYVEPPTVTVDPPSGPFLGHQAEAVALIKDGKVVRVEVVDKGCGYVSPPNIAISLPTSGSPAKAVCFFVENAL